MYYVTGESTPEGFDYLIQKKNAIAEDTLFKAIRNCVHYAKDNNLPPNWECLLLLGINIYEPIIRSIIKFQTPVNAALLNEILIDEQAVHYLCLILRQDAIQDFRSLIR